MRRLLILSLLFGLCLGLCAGCQSDPEPPPPKKLPAGRAMPKPAQAKT